jgi:peptidyl-prolyl cis-trans isomerase A (cyclophilin A)
MAIMLVFVPSAFAAPSGGKIATNPVVVMKTSMGEIKFELLPNKAPITVKNFLRYVESGYYKGTIFHRIIPGFMAQGGGMTSDLQPKPGDFPPIKNEAGNGLKNDRGTVAMARTGIVDSATSQFFINVVDNNFLNHTDDTPTGYGYAVFGKVIEGMDVVDKIVNAKQKPSDGMFQNVPEVSIVIESVILLK